MLSKSKRKLQSTENFIDVIKDVQMPHEYKLVYFDVKSLFTNIPLQLALITTFSTGPGFISMSPESKSFISDTEYFLLLMFFQ